LTSGLRISTELNGIFQKVVGIKVLEEYYNVHHFLCQYEYVNLSHRSVENTYLCLVLAPNTTRNHQDPLTHQQGGTFWTQDYAIQLHLGCSDLVSGLRTGVEAILTKLCVTKSNWMYAVPVPSDIYKRLAPGRRGGACVQPMGCFRRCKYLQATDGSACYRGYWVAQMGGVNGFL
jgi:hypothetical protein